MAACPKMLTLWTCQKAKPAFEARKDGRIRTRTNTALETAVLPLNYVPKMAAE
jgi:hypothetical protein